MTPVREMSDDQLQKEYSAAHYFFAATSADSGDSLETTMHEQASARMLECEAEMDRRGPPAEVSA